MIIYILKSMSVQCPHDIYFNRVEGIKIQDNKYRKRIRVVNQIAQMNLE